MEEKTYLKIFFPNGSFHGVRYTKSTKVADLIRTALKGRVSGAELFHQFSFAIRTSNVESQPNEKWLHPSMTMEEIQRRYVSIDKLKFELRFRYFPSPIDILIENKQIMSFFYEQIRLDYMKTKSETIPMNVAIDLGSLEIRKLFKDLNSTALDKKVNIDYLEKELGLRKFFPQSLIESQKARILRKCIKVCLKKYQGLAEEDCVKRFCFLLKDVWNWEQEIFTCNLGAEWSVPISLVLGPSDGISYTTQNSTKLTKMVSFEELLSISTSKHISNERILLKLNVARSSEILTFSFPTLEEAENVATVIDCYSMLFRQSPESLWFAKNEGRRNSFGPAFLGPHPSQEIEQHRESLLDANEETDADYAELLPSEIRIDRKRIVIVESLGFGQFGEVYRGIFKSGNDVDVAIKTCKINDSSTTDAFLEEAYAMLKFDHQHIIKLIGVCTDDPVLLIMELARLGELKTYLVTNRSHFDLSTLILYCEQLSSALTYLESKKFVHRDIATRNVLVSNHESVKLADFGLSRKLNLDNDYYKASKGKLPIRWMAPESINFRRFTHYSDVWMFAVCMWEILTMGKKPFQGVVNADVIDLIEKGIRLPSPGDHCPKALIDLWQRCWAYEPTDRPKFMQIQNELKAIYKECQSGKNQVIEPMSLKRLSLTDSHVPPKPFLPTRHSLCDQRTQSENERIPTMRSSMNRKDSSSRKNSTERRSSNSENKFSLTFSSVEQNECPEATGSTKRRSVSLLVDLFQSQTEQIETAVLKLTRQNAIDDPLVELPVDRNSRHVVSDREQLQMVKNIAIAVRDLLQTLDYAPSSIKQMSEQRYGHFSTLVVSLIELVRQRNYSKINEQAIDIARTANALYEDIRNLS